MARKPAIKQEEPKIISGVGGIPSLVEQGDYICNRFSEAHIKKMLNYLISRVSVECHLMTLNDITVSVYRRLRELDKEFNL